jgi:hypothetical protein
MRNRLDSEESAIEKHMLSRGVFMDKDTELQTDFDTLFKQLFCVTAQELADFAVCFQGIAGVVG